MKKVSIITIMFCGVLTLAGCGLRELVNLINCKFSLANISDITWAGINFSEINSISDLSLANLQKATKAIKEKDWNVGCNVNVNVKNETPRPAKLVAFDYDLLLENTSVATGEYKDKSYVINPSSVTKVPVPLKANVVNVFKKGEVGNIINLARNLTNYGNGKESNVKIKLTPYATLANSNQKLPTITLNKTFQ